MKRSIKTPLIVIALALPVCLAVLIWLGLRPDEPDDTLEASVLQTSQGPAFDVRVAVPRMGRPLGGILPDWLVVKLDGTPSELGFNNASSGARIGIVKPERLELHADGWDFFIDTDSEGRVASGTQLVFPLALGGRHVRLSCQPADPAHGYLRSRTRVGSDQLVGRFLVELASCKNADSGKASNWPPAPLTVRGSFVGQPQPPSLEPKEDRPKDPG